MSIDLRVNPEEFTSTGIKKTEQSYYTYDGSECYPNDYNPLTTCELRPIANRTRISNQHGIYVYTPNAYNMYVAETFDLNMFSLRQFIKYGETLQYEKVIELGDFYFSDVAMWQKSDYVNNDLEYSSFKMAMCDPKEKEIENKHVHAIFTKINVSKYGKEN